MDALLLKRRALKGQLTRLEHSVGTNQTQALTLVQVNLFHRRAEQLVTIADALFTDISVESTQEQFVVHEEEHHQMTTRLDVLQVTLTQLGQQLSPVTPPPLQPSTSQAAPPRSAFTAVRLPKLELPTFSGSIQEWLSFHDLYNATVHNNAFLTGAQKLQYLKSSLRGDAARLLQSIQVTDINYDEAWDILNQRYQNRREIVFSHLKRLFTQPALASESPMALQKLADVTTESLRALRVLQQPVDRWDSILVFTVAEKLDPDSRREWELSLTTDEVPTYSEMSKFIDQRARALISAGANKSKKPQSFTAGGGTQKQQTSVHLETTKPACPFCERNHGLYSCLQYLALPVSERSAAVKNFRLCYNCLGGNHFSKACKSGTCKKCGQHHHTSLHPEDQGRGQNIEPTVVGHVFNDTQVLLSTALVQVKDVNGQLHTCRALLDNGSQASFVSESCVQRLKLRRQPSTMHLNGIGSTSMGTARHFVQLTLSSRVNTKFNCQLDAMVLPRVTGTLPNMPCNTRNWNHIRGLKLADPSFHQPGDVDILIGADVFTDLLLSGHRRGPRGTPTALETTLGWILGGRVVSSRPNTLKIHHALFPDESFIRQFWELNETSTRMLTPDESTCEEHFSSTHTRDDQGRFVVKIPFREPCPTLGSSREMALRRFKQLERRLDNQPSQKEQYIQFMNEYQRLGHMEILPEQHSLGAEKSPTQSSSTTQVVNYIPHHYVTKDTSTSTKLRVVFDASAKTTSGVSFNETQLVGPKLQDDLIQILIRFRTHRFALTADVVKMYRQIKVHPEDTDYQRILWRDKIDQPIREFRLVTVTYGTASAPYIATRCLQQLARDEEQKFPLASAVALRDFYVDDLLTGEDSHERLSLLQSQLTQLMAAGCMDLRKFSSNDEALMDSLPVHMRETQTSLRIGAEESLRTLGLVWHPHTDYFSFCVDKPKNRPVSTKRTLLSDMSRIYDPLGWLSPVTIQAKVLFQQLWTLNTTWDDPLPQAVLNLWKSYQADLPGLELIQIPRCIKCPDPIRFQLHAFCDASERAYASVIYLWSVDEQGNVTVRIIGAKTKVSPLKQVSIPRLELCGATLLTRLVELVQNSLGLEIETVRGWTDSTTVLGWLASHPTRWKTFVANRVSEVQNTIPSEQWHYVKSAENPADCASRGISSEELLSHPLWWNGPQFLNNTDWENNLTVGPPSDDITKEEKNTILVAQVTMDLSLLQKYSSLSKLIRITAYCLRFVHNITTSTVKKTGSLSLEELNSALHTWIKCVQSTVFGVEIHCCQNNQALPSRSQLLSLNPFVDKSGLLRVGGRLVNANIAEDKKHPILLPRNHLLTKMIVTREHLRLLHAGPQLLLASLQNQFWILCGRDVTRHVVRSCDICKRQQATLAKQMMGNLPSVRVNPGRPFLKSGVDYAGPFVLRVLKGRGQKTFKGYIALFVCFVTHAIHLELVSDCTTTAFIAALKRFVSRRGRCSDLYSDCGSNFIGAPKELKEFITLTKSKGHNELINQHLGNEGMKWHYNPPAAPHFGGLWEAGVKSVKYHLRRVMGNTALNFEEMSTLLAQIEACLNSRPLCPMSSSPDDFSVLTPGHFLIGESMMAIPEPDYTHTKINRLSRWQLVQQLMQHFWNRWKSEYLSRLQQRPKWLTPKRNFQVGDLVLVKDNDMPPSKWKLGRVITLHPGNDNCVRVVTIKTSIGELKRPIVKLCHLPIDSSESV